MHAASTIDLLIAIVLKIDTITGLIHLMNQGFKAVKEARANGRNT